MDNNSTNNRLYYIFQGARQQRIALYTFCIIFGGLGGNYHWGWSVAAMAFYTFLGRKIYSKDYNPLDFADSVYYMGYTFTLIMLAFSLLFKTTTITAFSYFGTAVITSLLGIIIRSLFQYFYITPEETIDNANVRILEKVEVFLNKLTSLNNLALNMLNSAEDVFKTRLKTFEEEFKKSSKRLSDDLKKMNDAVNDKLNSFPPVIDNQKDLLLTSVKDISATVTKNLKAIEKLSNTSLEGFERLTQTTASTKNKITELSEVQNKLVEEFKEETKRLINDLTESIKLVSVNISGQLNTFLKDFDFTAQVSEIVKGLIDNIKALALIIKNQLKGLEENINFTEQFSALQTKLAEVETNLQSILNTLSSLHEDEGALNKIKVNTQNFKDHSNDISNEIKLTLESIIEINKQIKDFYSEGNNLAVGIQKIFAEVEDAVKQKIESEIGKA